MANDHDEPVFSLNVGRLAESLSERVGMAISAAVERYRAENAARSHSECFYGCMCIISVLGDKFLEGFTVHLHWYPRALRGWNIKAVFLPDKKDFDVFDSTGEKAYRSAYEFARVNLPIAGHYKLDEEARLINSVAMKLVCESTEDQRRAFQRAASKTVSSGTTVRVKTNFKTSSSETLPSTGWRTFSLSCERGTDADKLQKDSELVVSACLELLSALILQPEQNKDLY